MLSTLKPLVIAGWLVLAASAPSATFAQSHAELEALVQHLQANPTDTTLRERIIQMARALNPAPAIPAEARDYFIRGTTIAKAATDAAGQKLAVENFQKALRIAPWWADALYNLAVAQELAGDVDAAKASLRLYAGAAETEKERQDALDRISAIEAKKELAAAAARKAEEDLWNGSWREEYTDVFGQPRSSVITSRRTGDTIEFRTESGNQAIWYPRGHVQSSGGVAWEIQRFHTCLRSSWVPAEVTMSADGRTLRFYYPGYDHSECHELPGVTYVLTRQ